MEPSPVLSPVAQWAMVSGFFMPLVIAWINRHHWQADFKAFIAFLACTVATCVQLGVQGQLDFANFFPTLILVFAATITSFQGLWKPTGIADAVEKATTP